MRGELKGGGGLKITYLSSRHVMRFTRRVDDLKEMQYKRLKQVVIYNGRGRVVKIAKICMKFI